jgi:hypothetical protein
VITVKDQFPARQLIAAGLEYWGRHNNSPFYSLRYYKHKKLLYSKHFFSSQEAYSDITACGKLILIKFSP